MITNNQLSAIAAAIIGVAGVAAPAGAATDIFMSGSSAARQFISQIALPTCDTTQSVTHYQSANNNLHLYQCTFAGNLINFHYSARGSADGVYPVDDTTGGNTSKGSYNGKGFFGYIDSSNPSNSGCGSTSATNVTFYDPAISGNTTISIQENKTCANPPSAVTADWPLVPAANGYIRQPSDFGASDVQFTSFGQTSPSGSEPANPAPNVTENPIMVLPFNIVVQNNVRKLDSAGNNLGPIENLTQEEIEKIFSRNVRDWRQLGYGVTTATNGTGVLDTTATGNTIRLCLRDFGSGSKAAFDQVLMKEEATEWNTNALNVVFYSASSSGVRDCINDVVGTGLNGKVGYLDANETTGSPSWVTPAVANVLTLGHPVTINGYKSADAAAADRAHTFRALRCGKAEFWTTLNIYNKTTGTGNSVKDSFINSFITTAQLKPVIENIPVNWGFESPANMLVSKNADRGPQIQSSYTANAASYDAQCKGL